MTLAMPSTARRPFGRLALLPSPNTPSSKKDFIPLPKIALCAVPSSAPTCIPTHPKDGQHYMLQTRVGRRSRSNSLGSTGGYEAEAGLEFVPNAHTGA